MCHLIKSTVDVTLRPSTVNWLTLDIYDAPLFCDTRFLALGLGSAIASKRLSNYALAHECMGPFCHRRPGVGIGGWKEEGGREEEYNWKRRG